MVPRLRRVKGAAHITTGSPMKEGRFDLVTFYSERMRVRYRSRQNDRLRVMLVLVHIDITPPQIKQVLKQRRSVE
ncbi:hypothetical protein TNCV_2561891 [Trichonephila clavipes]|uniref:Uncharacterized protein n=1 Tax=Trichonephila clavipes TaxID=2585209 RepID=A0A8X6RAY9_TRICX|nr:hypothetical protein TNCV_2561891 [Trichonephila clavipes]